MHTTKWNWKSMELPSDVAETLALRFKAGVYEEAVRGADWTRATAEEIGVLVKLGDIYSRLEWLEKGLEVDRLLVRLHPDEPIYHYNLACSHSLLGELDAAFETLTKAIELGYDNFHLLRGDKDLENLKQDPRFIELLAQLESSM